MQAMTEVATDVPSGFEPDNPERITTWRARMAKLTVHETITFNDNDPEEGSS